MAINWNIKIIDETSSTQDDVAGCLSENEGYGVRALRQISGRGRFSRKWEEGKGNIYFSFLLKPDCMVTNLGQISFVVSVALAETVSFFSKGGFGLKWPNDLMVKNKKAAGILLEVYGKCLVVGIGVNISSCPEGRACLKNIVSDIDSDVFFNQMLCQIKKYYNIWGEEGFAPIRKLWLKHCIMMKKDIVISTVNEKFDGKALALDENGSLHVELPDGNVRIIASGDVYF